MAAGGDACPLYNYKYHPVDFCVKGSLRTAMVLL
jgi:hypothetical protein